LRVETRGRNFKTWSQLPPAELVCLFTLAEFFDRLRLTIAAVALEPPARDSQAIAPIA
jgi:hypothetical protein